MPSIGFFFFFLKKSLVITLALRAVVDWCGYEKLPNGSVYGWEGICT